MEEILASIRRIISEEDDPNANAAQAEEAVAEEAVAEEAALEEEAAAAEEVVEEPAETEEEGAEILELTDIVEEDGEEAEAEEESDLETTDLAALIEETEEEGPEIELVEDDDIPTDEPSPEPVPQAVPEGNSLLETATAMSATGSLSSLVAAVDQAQGRTPLGDGTRTVEDLVKEVMRPMVKEWLDENLPGVVDRLVRREIERLARTAEGDD